MFYKTIHTIDGLIGDPLLFFYVKIKTLYIVTDPSLSILKIAHGMLDL